MYTMICKGGKDVFRYVSQTGKNSGRGILVIKKEQFPVENIEYFDDGNAGYHRK